MDVQLFRLSLDSSTPPFGLSELEAGLWHAMKGNWHASHDIVQNLHGHLPAWIHAYLHKIEGDIGNANYWYAVAGMRPPTVARDDELELIMEKVLASRT